MEHKPQKPTIDFAALEALDIRMCRIESVEPVLKNPKKEVGEDNPIKAYKLTIDTGLDKRTCITNLIQFAPEILQGSICPFILNLPPAIIRGVESKAMIVVSSGQTVDLLKGSKHVWEGDVVL